MEKYEILPGWRVHGYVDRELFGKSYWKVHREMDKPVWFLGRSHRVLFHDEVSAYIIAKECYPNDDKAVLAAFNHIYCDHLCSLDPEYKKLLERLEMLNRKKKNRRAKQRPRTVDPLTARLIEDLKKIIEIKKTFNEFYTGN